MIKVTSFFLQTLMILFFLKMRLLAAHKISNISQNLSQTLIDERSTSIQGEVINMVTGKHIPYCNLRLTGTLEGTSTNELGQFIIDVSSLPVQLTFSHIGYEEKTVEVTNLNYIKVELTPYVQELNEVVINLSSNRGETINLVKAAFKNIKNTSDINKYAKAYYRQKSKNDDDYSELAEIIFDIEYNSQGIEDWEIIEGRFAIKKDRINNKNFTLLSRLMKSFQPETDELIFPLRQDFERYYNIRLIERLKSGDNVISVIEFRPKSNLKNPAPIFSGQVYISDVKNKILKVEGEIFQDDLKLITLPEFSEKKDYKLFYEIAFKDDELLGLIIDYIKINHEFNYFKNDKFITKVFTESSLNLYNYYSSNQKRRLENFFDRKQSDWEKINKIGYNKEFWENNPIVKRTPLEEEVIRAFDKANAFKTIYLNSNNQINVSGSDISQTPFVKELDELLPKYDSLRPVEKLYLHTNKSLFFKGETIFYSIYRTRSTSISDFSKIAYVDLINDKDSIISSKSYWIDSAKGKGSMDINNSLSQGKYILRGYTNWMRNFDENYFFYEQIDILGDESQVTGLEEEPNIGTDLQFFPEGGNAIEGLANRVAFKSTDNKGVDKNISAKIMNSSGEIITYIKTIANGAGFFTFIPKPNESYHAIVDDSLKFPLTKIRKDGYTMRIDNLNENTVKLNVQGSSNYYGKDFYIIGTINQKKYYQGKFNLSNDADISIEIPKNKFPNGLMTLTLFNSDRAPLSERVLFINNQQELYIKTKLSSSKLRKRQKLSLDISVNDRFGRPQPVDLSIAITDVKAYDKSLDASNILTHILLESELNGYIHNPNQYFKDKTRSSLAKLDLLMMTHGWRRILWSSIKQPQSGLEYNSEKDYSFSGVVTDPNNVPLISAKMNIILEDSKGNKGFYQTVSDSEGRFVVESIKEKGKVKAFFSAFDYDNKSKDIRIKLDDVEKGEFKYSPSKERVNSLVLNSSNENDFMQYANYGGILNGIILEEVSLSAKKNVKEESQLKTPSVYGIIPDAEIVLDEVNPPNFINLLNNVAGVSAYGAASQNGQVFVTIRGKGNPLWVVDGIPQPRPTTSPTYTNPPPVPIPSSVAALNPNDVERIEVIKGPKKGMFGARGSDGVILIYTKRTSLERTANSFVVDDFGLDVSREFYSPNYSIKNPNHQNPDYRSTIYWNPMVKTDSEGKATIEFYNSDFAQELQISINCISSDGLIGAYLRKLGISD